MILSVGSAWYHYNGDYLGRFLDRVGMYMVFGHLAFGPWALPAALFVAWLQHKDVPIRTEQVLAFLAGGIIVFHGFTWPVILATALVAFAVAIRTRIHWLWHVLTALAIWLIVG